MPINCLVNQRDKESKSQRDKGRKDRVFETLMFMNYSRIDHELIFWARIVQKLMRQLMGINGETFLGAHLGKTRSAPKKNWERT